jgi:hypothetical protein
MGMTAAADFDGDLSREPDPCVKESYRELLRRTRKIALSISARLDSGVKKRQRSRTTSSLSNVKIEGSATGQHE